MTEYEKLEYLHHIIQECMSENNSCTPYMLEKALEFVEDIREPYLLAGCGDEIQNLISLEGERCKVCDNILQECECKKKGGKL